MRRGKRKRLLKGKPSNRLVELEGRRYQALPEEVSWMPSKEVAAVVVSSMPSKVVAVEEVVAAADFSMP